MRSTNNHPRYYCGSLVSRWVNCGLKFAEDYGQGQGQGRRARDLRPILYHQIQEDALATTATLLVLQTTNTCTCIASTTTYL